jgi:hypothetical protein
MTREEAISCLADGHSLWTVETAKEICEAIDVPFDNKLISHYEGQKDANPHNDPKGLWLHADKPLDGVNALYLSDYVTDYLKLEVQSYIGRGFQAQANAEAIRQHFA